LIWVEEALSSSDGGQSDRHDSFEDFRNGFEEDDDAEGGRGVVGGLARLLHDYPVGGFKGGGVLIKSPQGGEEFEYDRGVDEVDYFPHGVGDPIRPRAEEGDDLERASLISSSVRGVAEGFLCRRPLPGRGSLGGKKWFRSALLIATRSEGSGREGYLGVFLGATSCLAVQMLFGEVFARKSAQ